MPLIPSVLKMYVCNMVCTSVSVYLSLCRFLCMHVSCMLLCCVLHVLPTVRVCNKYNCMTISPIYERQPRHTDVLICDSSCMHNTMHSAFKSISLVASTEARGSPCVLNICGEGNEWNVFSVFLVLRVVCGVGPCGLAACTQWRKIRCVCMCV